MSTSELRRTHPSPSDPLTVSLSISPQTRRATVTAAGEIDIISADQLGMVLTAALDRRPTALDVDLGAVTMIDSTGISVLMAARTQAISDRCPMTVTAVQPFVRRVLGICGLLEALNIAS